MQNYLPTARQYLPTHHYPRVRQSYVCRKQQEDSHAPRHSYVPFVFDLIV